MTDTQRVPEGVMASTFNRRFVRAAYARLFGPRARHL